MHMKPTCPNEMIPELPMKTYSPTTTMTRMNISVSVTLKLSSIGDRLTSAMTPRIAISQTGA